MAEIATHRRLPEWEQELRLEGFVVRCYDSVGSTMDLARALALEIPENGMGIVVAQSQHSGRGRQGRQWIPPQSGLYATVVLRSNARLESLSGLSLAVGVLVADVVSELGAVVQIKWPNDLLSVQGDKLGGILVETVGGAESVTALVGIGINLTGEPMEIPGTTSLATLTGQTVSPVEMLHHLAPALARGWQEFRSGGFSCFRDRFMARACFVGEQITLDHGGAQESGTFHGVDHSGALQVMTPAGVVSRASGEVKNVRRVGSKS